MLRARYFVRLVKAFLFKFRSLILLGIFFGFLIFLGFRFLGPTFLGGKTERIGIAGRFRSDDLPSFIIEMVGDGLTEVDTNGFVKPNLASSWETPDKGKTWIFHLNEEKFWHDGEKVTSEDIVYEFSDLTIERPDEKTLIFALQNPFSPFPSVVSRPTFRKGLLGTGEWEVKDISISGSFIQKIEIAKGKEKKIYHFYPTEERAKLAYKLGSVDILLNVVNPSPLDTWDTTKVSGVQNKSLAVLIFFNVSDKVLSEKSMRQALSYAIKKEDFDGERAISPISPESWAFNAQVKPYTYDLEKAKSLISELPKELTENLIIKLSTSPILLPVAEQITKDWEEVGVKSQISVSSEIPSDSQALLVIFDVPRDPDQYSVWHSTQTSTNISHYQSPRIDKLLEDGRAELNLEERKKIYLDFQRFLIEDSPAVFLYHPISYKVERK